MPLFNRMTDIQGLTFPINQIFKITQLSKSKPH